MKMKKEKKKQWSYDKMLIDWVRSGRTGKYLALGQDARTSSQKYFPFRPSHSGNKYTLCEKNYNNKHLMTGPKKNNEFCFPETLSVFRGEAEENISTKKKLDTKFVYTQEKKNDPNDQTRESYSGWY